MLLVPGGGSCGGAEGAVRERVGREHGASKSRSLSSLKSPSDMSIMVLDTVEARLAVHWTVSGESVKEFEVETIEANFLPSPGRAG